MTSSILAPSAESDLCMRVTFRDGRIASIFEYYGERAHEGLLGRLGAGC